VNKKGALTDLFVMIVTFFSIAIIIGLALYMFGAFVPALQANAAKIDKTGQASEKVDLMASDISAAFSNFNWFAMVNIGAIIMLFFITNAFIKANPMFLFPYVCAIAIAIWFSVSVSNQYETLLNNAVFSGLSTIPSVNGFLLHLPAYTTIIGFIGAILLFVRIDFENM
jgi:hypothetical protein